MLSKNSLSKLLCLGWLLMTATSCDPKNIGPVGSFANRNWQLVEYRVHGQQRPLSDVPDRVFLETQEIDSTFFTFMDAAKKVKIFEQYFIDDFDVSRQRDVGYYYFKTTDKRFCRVVMGWDEMNSLPTRLEIGNLIKGSYQPRADTVRYYYSPL